MQSSFIQSRTTNRETNHYAIHSNRAHPPTTISNWHLMHICIPYVIGDWPSISSASTLPSYVSEVYFEPLAVLKIADWVHRLGFSFEGAFPVCFWWPSLFFQLRRRAFKRSCLFNYWHGWQWLVGWLSCAIIWCGVGLRFWWIKVV